MRRIISLVAGFSSLVLMPFVGSAVVSPPDVDRANFVPGQTIDNRYFPQVVGKLFLYEGTNDGGRCHAR
jgi:hypothetical protein